MFIIGQYNSGNNVSSKSGAAGAVFILKDKKSHRIRPLKTESNSALFPLQRVTLPRERNVWFRITDLFIGYGGDIDWLLILHAQLTMMAIYQGDYWRKGVEQMCVSTRVCICACTHTHTHTDSDTFYKYTSNDTCTSTHTYIATTIPSNVGLHNTP